MIECDLCGQLTYDTIPTPCGAVACGRCWSMMYGPGEEEDVHES